MRGIFFDRDGVLNDLVPPNFERGPRELRELSFNDEAPLVIQVLSSTGYHCEIISNQPDYSRGKLTGPDHLKICQAFEQKFPEIKKQRYCLHDNADNCECRKPKIGLLNQAVSEFGLDPEQSWLVGDKWTDVLAAKNFNCRSILIENSNSWKSTSQGCAPINLKPDFLAENLTAILDII